MKTILTSIFVALAALCAAPRGWAQSSPQKADSVLLSERVDGDYHVKDYLVQQADEADYSVHYRINNATLNQALEKNGATLQELDTMASKVLADTLNRVERVTIIGYASPDGPLALNKSLAKRRAEDMQRYVDQHYRFSKRYDVELDAKVPAWGSIREAVASSAIPHRDSVLHILDGDYTEVEKQAALKRMPKVWHYLAIHVLPPIRRAEVMVDYQQGMVVSLRTLIPKAAPEPKPETVEEPEVVIVEAVEEVVDPCCEELCGSEQLGVIVDMTGVEIDY